ncbi:MAG: hypothetical protein IAI49_11000 [Candidatus Eremiobacteraeota bacterium]|nr:hypothetical protein [Candidatus Eremiobacteraeota bacterium]
MKQFASVRFADVLAASERETMTRTLASVGAEATSWNVAADRTYACARSARDGEDALRDLLRAELAGACVDSPPIAVLRVSPDRLHRLAPLASALGGAGRPAGVVRCATERSALVVEVDVRATPLSLIVALIDVETSGGRRIEPILPLCDDVLAELAGSILGEPDLDASRLIEPYLESLGRPRA